MVNRKLTSELELVQYIKSNNYDCQKLSCCGGKRVMVLSNGRSWFANALNYGIPCPFQRNCAKFPLDEPMEKFVGDYLRDHEAT